MNAELNYTRTIVTDRVTNCFNVIVLSEGRLLVDCQVPDNMTDTLYIIDEDSNQSIPYSFVNSPVTTSTNLLIKKGKA